MVTAMAPNVASMSNNNGPTAARQSIADLTTNIKTTKGDVPPPLVGASTTIIGENIYVFDGRVASTRQMTNHLYILHIPTLVWVRHIAPPDSASPPVPRYFHSSSTYLDQYIVVFGGMGNTAGSRRPRQQQLLQQQQQQMSNGDEQLSAMDDISMFDVDTMCWIDIKISPSIFTPQARYAHLSTVWDSDKLVVMGGQDIANQHINEINVFDLKELAWIHGGPINGPYDAYRAVAFCPLSNTNNTTSAFGRKGTTDYFWNNKTNEEIKSQPQQKQQAAPPVCVYSNYNFNDLTRELQSFYPMKSAGAVEFHNHAADMTGSLLPPGLRFPTGQLVGQYFVVSGTFLSSTKRGFQVWALNLTNLTWSHIDTSSNLSNGSWNRGLLSNQKYYVLGHSQRDLKEDYSYRRTNFDHIASIDLEAYGIYCLPTSTCSSEAQELGLSMLNEPSITDLTIWTSDQQALPINSIILAERWPGFAQILQEQKTTKTSTIKPSTNTLQIQKKQLLFPESYSVTLAFLQFIYTDHLITAQQHQPQILCRLLILADMYKMKRLLELTTYALHQLLTISTASMVYETAALTFQSALQIRALRIMINAKRMLLGQQHQQQKEVPSLPQHHHQQMQQSLSSPTYNNNHEQYHHQVEFTSFSATTSPSTSMSVNSPSSGSIFSDEPQSPMSLASSTPSAQSYSSFRRLAQHHQQMVPPSPGEKPARYMMNNPIKSSSSTSSKITSSSKSNKKQGYFDLGSSTKYLTALQ